MSANSAEMVSASKRLAVEAARPNPNSRKFHVQGTRNDIRVEMREIEVKKAPDIFGGETSAPIKDYTTSGLYTDPTATIDWLAGLPPLRQAWIKERGDTELSDRASPEYAASQLVNVANLAKRSIVAQVRHNALSRARFENRREDQFNLSFDPEKARSFHDETWPEDAHEMAHFRSICGPNLCSMKITEDVRDYAAKQGLENVIEAITKGMEEKAKEFVEQGGEVYSKA